MFFRSQTPTFALSFVSKEDLHPSDMDEIQQLYTQSISRSKESFAQASVDEWVLGRTSSGALCAVAALSYAQHAVNGRTHVVIWTSIVAVAKGFRGRGVTVRMGLHTWLRCRVRYPQARLYWAFSGSTLAAYLLMVRNFAEHYPRHDQATPAPMQQLMHLIGRRLGTYEPTTGLASTNLLPNANVPLGHPSHPDPAAQYFYRRNPHADRGDVLLCLCPLTWANGLHIVGRHVFRVFQIRSRVPPHVAGSHRSLS